MLKDFSVWHCYPITAVFISGKAIISPCVIETSGLFCILLIPLGYLKLNHYSLTNIWVNVIL